MTEDVHAALAAARQPVDLEDVRDRVEAVLAALLRHHRATVAEVDPASSELMDAIEELVHGGKRLRAAFTYWGWRGAGRPSEHAPIVAAAGVELFQAAALIHDDVIDASATRRGVPTIHERFAAAHANNATVGLPWHGDDRRYGEAAAILAGNLCLAWSSELVTNAATTEDAVRPPHGRAARAVYDTMVTQLMAGQLLDVTEQAQALGTVERALQVIRFKSAKYTIEHPLLLGGSLAGAEPAVLQTYSNYALPLGEAFQLRDDLLGVFGDPALTGKPSGDDIREGKRTALIAVAGQRISGPEQQALAEALGNQDLSSHQLDRVREILTACGAVDTAEQMIARCVEEADAALDGGVIDPDAAAVLRALIAAATKRHA